MMRFFIRSYRFLLSPWIGNQCRFSPTCSHYAEEAYERHGFIKGTILTFFRIIKCHPWYKGEALDSVPKRFAYKDLFRYKSVNTSHKE